MERNGKTRGNDWKCELYTHFNIKAPIEAKIINIIQRFINGVNSNQNM